MYKVRQSPLQDNQSYDINYEIIKKLCVDHIYESIDISRYKYDIIEYTNDLPKLLEKKYSVSANIAGLNCLLVFIKIKDKYHQFLIDRKTLSYNSQKVNMAQVKLTHVNVKLDINIYKDRGTIFDGTFVQGKTSRTFIITDAYLFKGVDMTNTTINSKLLSVSTYFNTNYRRDDRENNLEVTVNKLFEMSDVGSLVTNVIPKISDFVVKGLSFYPEISGTKLIYMFDQGVANAARTNVANNIGTRMSYGTQVQPVVQVRAQPQLQPTYQLGQQNRQNQPPMVRDAWQEPPLVVPVYKKQERATYVPKKGYTDTDYVFEMRKTDIIDVYNLNVIEKVTKGDEKLYKRIKIGIAFVSSLVRSRWCDDVMSKYGDVVLVHCTFHPQHQKWEPHSVADAKKPSYVTNFEVIQPQSL